MTKCGTRCRPLMSSNKLFRVLVAAPAVVTALLLSTFRPVNLALATPMPSAHVPVVVSASASAKKVTAPVATPGSTAPDPTPVESREHWRYEINVRDGEMFVGVPKKIDKGRVMAAPRRFGRFAIEMMVGDMLLERVRFDIPLFWGGEAPQGNLESPPDFEKKARLKMTVEVPHVDRANAVYLVDRLKGTRKRIPWPPVDELPKVDIPGSKLLVPKVGHQVGLCAPEPILIN